MKNTSKLNCLVVVLIFISLSGFTQPITFSKIYNFGIASSLMSVQQTSDSGYIASGWIGRNYEDAYILKLNQMGDTIWTRSYGYSYRDWASEIQTTSDGGYIVAGRKNYHIDMERMSMYGDIWILKLDASGDTLWTKTYGGLYNDYANSIKQTSDGGYIVAGTKNNYGINSSGDIWILKLDQLGDTLWTKTFHFSNNLSEANSIVQTSADNYIICGSASIGNLTNANILVMKLNSVGDSIWCKKLDGYIGIDIIQADISNMIIVGNSNTNNKMYKLNENGSVIWEENYPPNQGCYFHSNSLALNESGDIISVGQRINTNDVGNTTNDLWIKKNLSYGTSVWTKTQNLSINDIGNSVKATNDNGFIIAGVTNHSGWLLKLDQNCEFALNVDSVYNLISGNWYKVIECMGFTGRCDSVYSDDLNQIERIAGTDSITWKVFQNDKLVKQSKYKISYSYSYIYHSYKWMLSNARLIIYSNQNSFSVGLDAADGGGTGYSRTKSTTGIISTANDHSDLLFFPNPVSFGFSVKGVGTIESIQVFDLNGKSVESKVNIPTAFVDISKLTQGIYFVHVITKNKIYIGKIIKE